MKIILEIVRKKKKKKKKKYKKYKKKKKKKKKNNILISGKLLHPLVLSLKVFCRLIPSRILNILTFVLAGILMVGTLKKKHDGLSHYSWTKKKKKKKKKNID